MSGNVFRVQVLRGNPQFAPTQMTPGSAGYDVRARLNESIYIMPGERRIIPLGFRAELPAGHVAFLFIRSGWAKSRGLSLANGVGVIDADYRDEWASIVVNQNPHDSIKIDPYERIGQIVIVKYESPTIELVPALEMSERHGGFGSTGKA